MANVYIGDSKALVFPVMCDGYLKLDADTVGTATSKGNFWNHTDNFTIEAIITPYDVNGNGHGSADIDTKTSTRTPPSPAEDETETNFQSARYFGTGNLLTDHITNRLSHKMMLFYNNNFKFYLQNTTTTNYNQPAEYKLCVDFTNTSGLTTTVSSDNPIITAVNTLHGYYDSNGYYEKHNTSLTKLTSVASITGTLLTFTSGTDAEKLVILDELGANNSGGTEIFNSSGVSLGKVLSKNTLGTNRSATLSLSQSSTITGDVYVSQPREALYLEEVYKVSCSYRKNGQIELYVNNQSIKTQTLSVPTFEFDSTTNNGESRIGKGTLTSEQFMGEFFEISMHKGKEPSLTINTLTPSYSNILFYYTFGE
tara:strand:+ start:13018 stop:14121 length:1104 start_codon:yes stop_codon:yes gene_type:complete